LTELWRHQRHASDVASRSIEVWNKASHDWIKANDEHNRDSGCRRLGCEGSAPTPDGHDNCNILTNQVPGQCRQLIKLPVGPAECDVHVLALDVASVFQTLAESRLDRCGFPRRSAAQEPDHRYRQLRARAASGHAAAAPPSSVMNARLLTRSPRWQWRSASARFRGRAPSQSLG